MICSHGVNLKNHKCWDCANVAEAEGRAEAGGRKQSNDVILSLKKEIDRGKTMTDSDIFDLDVNRLDEEWVNQPSLYFRNAQILADARAEYERAKADRDVVSAEIDRDIRSNPSKYGLEKVTEGAVDKAVVLQSKHTKANEAVIKAKHKMDIAASTVEALEHRKYALQNLVQLRLADYFSEPRVKGEVGKKMKEEEEKAAFQRRRK